MVKIRIKFGVVEIEYEGEDKYLSGGLKALLGDLHAIGPPPTDEHAPDKTKPSNSLMKNAKDEAHSTSTRAQKFGEDSGPDLILAAAMRLTLTGLFKFTKSQIRQEIKDARAYYESRYSSNFEADLQALIGKSRIAHNGGEYYSLVAKDLARFNVRSVSAEASLFH